MATKKECDRCGKQWDPTDRTASSYDSKDAELSSVYISIPYQSSRHDRLKVDKSYELCQGCAREVHKVLEQNPTKAPLRQSEVDHANANILKRVQGE